MIVERNARAQDGVPGLDPAPPDVEVETEIAKGAIVGPDLKRPIDIKEKNIDQGQRLLRSPGVREVVQELAMIRAAVVVVHEIDMRDHAKFSHFSFIWTLI